MKVLVYAHRDIAIAEALQKAIENEAFRVTVAPFAFSAFDAPDLARFVRLLKDYDVLVTYAGVISMQTYRSLKLVIGRIRQADAETPIVVFTDDESANEAELLVAGADYCVGEPKLDPSGDSARLLRAVLERVGSRQPLAASTSEEEVRVAGLTLDTNRFRLIDTARRAEARLTKTETLMLAAMMRRPEVVFSRSQLMDVAYPDDTYLQDRTVDCHIKRIRNKKLPQLSPAAGQCIQTLYGAGYFFSATKAQEVFPSPARLKLAVSA